MALIGPSSARLVFATAGKRAGRDFSCLRFPGTADDILFRADLIAMVAFVFTFRIPTRQPASAPAPT